MNYSEHLRQLEQSGNLRTISRENTRRDGIINLSANDYLGLADRPGLEAEFFENVANRAIPMTSSASRLLVDDQSYYAPLEQDIEKLYRRPALLFNSGYHANTGLVQALADRKTLILADRLVHASIIDGIRLSGAAFTRFRHNDTDHLERLIEKEEGRYDTILVIVESVYSMDGDHADIDRLIDIRRSHPTVMLYVDEAHAFGVEGKWGLGLTAGRKEVDVTVCTLGKAAASMGAFAVFSSSELRDYVINTARSFIFSTALPPMNVAWSLFIIQKMVMMDDERRHLHALAERLQRRLQPMSPDFSIEASHIQPFVVGDARRAVELSRRLLTRGFKVLPIRTPTVPPGTERLRISLSASLTTSDIDNFIDALTDVCDNN